MTVAVALSLGLLGSACAGPLPAPRTAPSADPRRPVADLPALPARTVPVYRLQVGDRLRIAFAHDSELDQDVAVRPDGFISLPLAGEVQAQGHTPRQLGQALQQRLQGILRDPEPTVIVREFQRQEIFVGGGVRAPGAFRLSRGLTALRAITTAGGALDPAALRSVVVIRQPPGGDRLHLRLDLAAHLASGADQDLPLQAGDLVFVTSSPRNTEAGSPE